MAYGHQGLVAQAVQAVADRALTTVSSVAAHLAVDRKTLSQAIEEVTRLEPPGVARAGDLRTRPRPAAQPAGAFV